MLRLSHLAVFLLALLSFNSCDDPDIVADRDIDLSSQFNASIYETFENSGKRSVWLHIETREEYACNNYELDVRSNKSGNDIYIEIMGITRPPNTPCESGVNNATTNIEFGPLNQGDYTLHLTLLDEIQETATLTNSPDSYRIELPEDTWLEMSNFETKKVPDNTVWGYYLSESGHFDQLAVDYIDGLETFGAPLENDGFFGAFSVNQGQIRVIEIDKNDTHHFNGFGMRYNGDKELLKEWIMENYCMLDGQLGLYSTTGDLTPCE